MLAKKSLGQNFLMHAATAERIADTGKLSKNDIVLEIGPGTGMLTKALLARAGKVIAVEADRELIPQLQDTFSFDIASGRLQLIHADIREFDPSVISEPYSLVANIPYYITGEILRHFLTAKHQPTSMTLLVQKEVAERIVRAKKESLLSLSVKAYGTPSYAFTVPKGSFVPAPKVDSAVLHISNINREAFTEGQEERFFEILRAGFGHKRKQLINNLEVLAPREKILEAFSAVGLSEKVRSEDVPLSSWLKLSSLL